jgi:hypothetical protein
LQYWPDKEEMAAILRAAGLAVTVGRYSIRVKDCFSFQEYGGDLSNPRVEADAESLEAIMSEGKIVSDALARAGIRHRFELYNNAGQLVGYLHHEWPAMPG